MDFVEHLKKYIKQLGFNLTLNAADLQDIIYTTLGDDIEVNFDNLLLFVPIFIPDAKTQILFKDSFKKSFAISFDSCSSDRKKS